ncbi:MAG: hypothetical protein K2N51_12390 [Lachnospiraceae bacterium]|nr:hypothetical protein [Lachnospiraceae bacterium]
MINTKKIAAILLAAGLTCNPYNIPSTTLIHAEEATIYEQASVVSIDNLDEYNTKASISWSCELMFPEDREKEVSDYASFTLEKDSIVKMGVKYTDIGSNPSTSPDVIIYSNEARTVKKLEFSFYNSGDSKTVYLPAGTYYIEAKDKRLLNPGVKIDISICALSANKALSAVSNQDRNKSQATVTVTQALGEDLENIQYVYGAYGEKDNTNKNIWKTPLYKGSNSYYKHIATEVASGNAFTVKKNGTYTIRVITKDGAAYSIQHKIKGLDNTAPQITGVKNGKTYKKAVTIRFSDKGSGIKSAKLNGKTITSGKKVSKKGKYTLKVTDKANNTKTVKFIIKK